MSFLSPGAPWHRQGNLFLNSTDAPQPPSSVLYHFDASFVRDIGPATTDLTGVAFNPTVIGLPSKFGAGAARFADSWVESIANDSFFNTFPIEAIPGLFPGTIDFWAAFTGGVVDNNLINIGNGAVSSTDNFTLRRIIATGKLQVYQLIAGVPTFLINGATAIPADGVYRHIALVRNQGVLSLYLNGILDGSTATPFYTGPANAQTNPLIVGGPFNFFGGGFNMVGGIDELRFVKGSAAWTSAFTPPSNPYTY